MSIFFEKYKNEVLPAIRQEFGITNVNAAPRIEKVCLNMGVGKSIDDSKMLDVARREMGTICGQLPAITQARVAVSNFRLREGMRIGCRTTLRNKRMYEFMDRLLNVAVPRIRDFRGLKPSAFDKAGNFSIGVEEITIFPEINADTSEYSFGMDVTIVIRNSTGPKMSRRMLSLLGFPFAEAKSKSDV